MDERGRKFSLSDIMRRLSEEAGHRKSEPPAPPPTGPKTYPTEDYPQTTQNYAAPQDKTLSADPSLHEPSPRILPRPPLPEENRQEPFLG